LNATDNQVLFAALYDSVIELQKSIEMHCCLVTSILEGRLDQINLQALPHRCSCRAREIAMKKAIQEAIDELEESKKAFKSKRLEALRKKLIHALIETG